MLWGGLCQGLPFFPMKKDLKRMKRALSAAPAKAVLTKDDFVSTGSTLLNLAYTGRPFRGYAKGKCYLFVGDSESLKTWLALSLLAEAARNSNFDDYRLIHDNAEEGALMDIERFFGSKLAKRLEGPAPDVVGSRTVEDFYGFIDDAVKAEKPFIYVLDSENVLTSESEEDKFAEQKKARAEEKDVAGSYGDGKAKIHSANLRRVVADLRDTRSILVILSQTRDNLQRFGFMGDPKTRSGGRALRFYASLEAWSSLKEKIKRTVKGKPREIGSVIQVAVKKNRFTGKHRTITIDFYNSVGIDDIGTNIDYLVDEKHWKKSSKGIIAPEFDFTGTRDALIAHIEENRLERKLAIIVGEVWAEIEAACAVERKPRYE